MSKFEYTIPGETTVKRMFTHDDLARDTFALQVAGEVVVTLDYDTARRYWMGKIALAEILAGEAVTQ